MNEKQLIHSSRRGDSEAFAKLYGLYKERLYRYAYYRLGNPCDAEDAVCDTVLMAFEGIGDLRKASAFSAWIFRLHYSTCSKYVARQIDMKESANIDDYENSAKLSTNINTLSAELNEGLNILTDHEREVVLLSVIAGFNSREISDITGLTDGSVRCKLSRSLEKMRNFLE
mgnify:FL=1